MYLEEIVLDGFKSYANRTVISDFDPQFNAITGLNGSGKSNILDAICFVLGITNLSQVRVRSLQELVYKQGQAGVTKASVTLVFNNRDSNSSPVGYEQYETISVTRQVVIGGRNKYLINGHTAQVSQVQNLFHSVQLNGRITKVLNMKPPEILGMVEEAAGTRMFEDKKEGAKNVIAKKQGKVDEINKLLSEEITPTLELLRKQRTAYIQWTNNSTEIERLSRFKVAYEYNSHQEIVEKGEETIQELKDQKEDMTETVDNLKIDQGKLKSQITELTKTKNEQLDTILQSLQNEENQKSKDLVKKNGELQNEEKNLQREEENYKDLEQQEKEITGNITEMRQKIDKCTSELNGYEEEYKKAQTLLEEFENAMISIENGNITTEDDGNINERIAENTRIISNSKGIIAQNKQKLVLSKETLNSLQSKIKICEEDVHKYKKNQDTITSSIKKYEGLIQSLQFDENRYNKLQKIMSEKEAELQSLSDEIESLDAPISAYLKFEYTTPTNKNFHKEGVKGVVANLIHIKDDKYTTALETVAGGKLYQVIVDTEETGKYILNEGRLRRRYTFIPLNRIKSKQIPLHKVSLAQRIGGNDVNTAISFIASDEELQPALQYVFGNAFICKDLEIAKKVTFNEGINVRSVTLDGDSFDPSGTLEGGSRDRDINTLSMLHKINSLKEKQKVLQEEYNKIKKEYEHLNYKKKQYTEYMSSLELEKHNLELLMDTMKNSEYSKLKQQLEETEKEIESYEQLIEEYNQKEKEASNKIKELEKKQKEYSSSKETHLKQITKKIGSTKKDIKKKEQAVNTSKLQLQEYQIEENQLQSELSGITSKLKASKTLIDSITINKDKLLAEVSYLKESYQSAHQAVEGKKTELEVLDIKIKQLTKEEDQNTKKMNEMESAISKINSRIQKYEKDKVENSKFLAKLINDHPWIEQEKQYFGNENTDYDFYNKNPKEMIDRLTKLQTEQDKLGRHINKKVMTMLEKAEGEYQDLLKKKRIIEKDKAQIQHVIEELENKKNEALQKTYLKVNRDFGEIFTSLLPGASARLEPPEGQSVTEGLEVRVAFSGKDKEGLSELSGGQRSLLALSLVLALLLFKPAPMYILDEVDAALDLSHTQNIGRMLRKHFSQSQFIIVSLKEGMFNNANVIFRTKFVDGVSTVTRTVGRMNPTDHENEDNSKRRR